MKRRTFLKILPGIPFVKLALPTRQVLLDEHIWPYKFEWDLWEKALSNFLISQKSRLQSSRSENIPATIIPKIVDAIYWAEGGPKTRYPYGVKSIDTGGDHNKARRICETTIYNRYYLWQSKTKEPLADNVDSFIDFASLTYCPVGEGNKNWRKNVKFYYHKPKPLPPEDER